jgi:ABC-type sulfate/molybdate transport systems ATPase subunit
MVSHDPTELNRLADRVVELRAGKIAEDQEPDKRSKGSPLSQSVMEGTSRILEIEIKGKQAWVQLDTGEQAIRISIPATVASTLKPGQTITFKASIDNFKIQNNP